MRLKSPALANDSRAYIGQLLPLLARMRVPQMMLSSNLSMIVLWRWERASLFRDGRWHESSKKFILVAT